MVWNENFHFKPFPNSHAKRERDRTQREIEPRVQSPSTSHPSTLLFDREIESNPDRTERDRRWTQSPSISSFDREIASHRERSSVNPEPRSRLRLRRDRTPRSHRDGTDRIEIAIEKWLGFDEFDRIWWIFFGWVLFLCLSIEKWYYIFVWKLRKCEEQEENVFSILFSAT